MKILSTATNFNKNSGLYAIAQFTVVYYDKGEDVSERELDGYLWDGAETWAGFVPGPLTSIDGCLMERDTFAITDTVAIVGNVVGGDTALQWEIYNTGNDIFEGHEKELLDIARSLPRPEKKHPQYSTFLTLWRVVYQEYNTIESFFPEYDVYAELVGLLDLAELVSEFDLEKLKALK